jgi:hypothetical protein
LQKIFVIDEKTPEHSFCTCRHSITDQVLVMQVMMDTMLLLQQNRESRNEWLTNGFDYIQNRIYSTTYKLISELNILVEKSEIECQESFNYYKIIIELIASLLMLHDYIRCNKVKCTDSPLKGKLWV